MSQKDFHLYIEQLLGSAHEANNFIDACHRPLKKSITIMNHHIDKSFFFDQTKKNGRTFTDPLFTPKSSTFYVDRDPPEPALGKTFFHQSGFFYIQEIAASLPPLFLDLPNNALVLDMCSAPGGKTSQISDLLFTQNNTGIVVANDPSYQRVQALSHNLNRVCAYNTLITNTEGERFGANMPEMFDAILLDAPCSGEGTSFKSDSATKFWKETEIKKIAGLQFLLLQSAVKALKPGGILIFSTCTLNTLENEGNLKKIMETFPDILELEDIDIQNKSFGYTERDHEQLLTPEDAKKVVRLRPHIHHTGGFFISKLRKKKSLSITPKKNKKEIHRWGFTHQFNHGPHIQKLVRGFLGEEYGISPTEEITFFQTKEKIYLCQKKVLEISDKIRAEKIGVPICKINRDQLIPLHQAGVIFGSTCTKNFFEITDVMAQQYANGQDLSIDQPINTPASSYIFLKRQGLGIGVGKYKDGVIKNKYFQS